VKFGTFQKHKKKLAYEEYILCIRAQWEAQHDGAEDLWLPQVSEVSLDSLGVIAHGLCTYSCHIAKAKVTVLLKTFDARSVDGRSARACLLSCACRPASAWLDTLPLT
jgi:hypothetical protein